MLSGSLIDGEREESSAMTDGLGVMPTFESGAN